MVRTTTAVLAIGWLALVTTHAQARWPLTGAVLIGQVVEASSGRGLDRTVVTVESSGRRWSIGVDPYGRFLFSGLPAGAYTVTARRQGYLPGVYGQRFPGGSHSEIFVVSGQWMSNIDVQLWRPAVVIGDVRDDGGDPVVGLRVHAYQQDLTSGHARLVQVRVAETDDRGVYRLSDLVPGDYFVASSAEHDNESLPGLTLTPTMYPSSDSVGGASMITVHAGREVHGINFSLRPAQGIAVRGRVDVASIPDGRREHVQVRLVREPDAFVLTPDALRIIDRTTLDADGAFTFERVPPGTWIVEAFLDGTPPPVVITEPGDVGGGGVIGSVAMTPPAPGEPETYWAQTPFTVFDQPVNNLALELQPGMSVSGHTIVRSRWNRTMPQQGGLTVVFDPLSAGARRAQVRTAADGRFVLSGALSPGQYLVRVSDVPPGLTLRAVNAGGTDISDAPLDLSLGIAPGDVTIELTDGLTQITGTVRGVGPLGDGSATVLALPQDARTPTGRRLRAVRAGVDGTFTMRDLPPGNYMLVAIDAADEAGWQHPDRLRLWRARGTLVRLTEGAAVVVELRRPSVR